MDFFAQIVNDVCKSSEYTSVLPRLEYEKF